MTERQLGQKWARIVRARTGWKVEKLEPTYGRSGLPDYLVVGPEVWFLEAKVASPGSVPFRPSMLEPAQRRYLRDLHNAGQNVGVLLLDHHGWALVQWPTCTQALEIEAFMDHYRLWSTIPVTFPPRPCASPSPSPTPRASRTQVMRRSKRDGKVTPRGPRSPT